MSYENDSLRGAGPKTLLLLYKGVILPHVDFGAIIIKLTNKNNIMAFERNSRSFTSIYAYNQASYWENENRKSYT